LGSGGSARRLDYKGPGTYPTFTGCLLGRSRLPTHAGPLLLPIKNYDAGWEANPSPTKSQNRKVCLQYYLSMAVKSLSIITLGYFSVAGGPWAFVLPLRWERT